MKLFFGSIIFGAALISAGALQAQDRDHMGNSDSGHADQAQPQRYYDSAHKDWHNWDDSENTRFMQYEKMHNRHDKDFSHMSKSQQNQYFKWSHTQTEDRH